MKIFCLKLIDALSTIWGWFVALFLFLLDFFCGYGMALNLILILILTDLGWGIAVAVRCKRYALSECARNTVSKVFSYYGCLLIVILIEKMLGAETTLGVSLVTTAIALTELWSISGNMLIVNPKIPVIRLLRVQLIGEIARKLNLSESQVKEALDNDKDLTKERATNETES